MIKNLFKTKSIIINNNEMKFRHGFYEVGNLQDKLDLLLVTAKLLDYDITTFFMKNNTGFYLILAGKIRVDFNFFIKRNRVYAIEISYKEDDAGIFYVGNQRGLNEELNKIVHSL